MDLPASAECPRPGAEETEIPGSRRRSQADRVEGAAVAPQTLHCAGGPRQTSKTIRAVSTWLYSAEGGESGVRQPTGR